MREDTDYRQVNPSIVAVQTGLAFKESLMQVRYRSALLSALLARTSSSDLKVSEGLQSVFVPLLAVLSHITPFR